MSHLDSMPGPAADFWDRQHERCIELHRGVRHRAIPGAARRWAQLYAWMMLILFFGTMAAAFVQAAALTIKPD